MSSIPVHSTRREFTKFLGLIPFAFLIGTFAAAARNLWQKTTVNRMSPALIGHVNDVVVGGYKLFRYPTKDDPCILLRLDHDRFVAFNQNCSHLSCPVHYDTSAMQLLCPCHKGSFSVEDGRPLAGPPNRPLATLSVSIRKEQVWVKLA